MKDDTDKEYFIRLQQDHNDGLRFLFEKYYVSLCRYVNTLIEDEVSAADIVQDIFIYFWEHRQEIVITDSVRSYLFTSCRYKALNHFRDNRKYIRFEQEQHDMVYEDLSVETDDLHRLIEEAVMSLPEKCGKIFRLSRDEDLSYKEIAQREGVAVKTVEAQIHTAIIRLRKYLTNHLYLFW